MTARKIIPRYLPTISCLGLSSILNLSNGTKHPRPDPKTLCSTLNVHLLLLFALELNEHRETDVKESNWLCVKGT